MNTLEIKGKWNVLKGKIEQNWAKLTENDLQFIKGKKDELIGRIQKRSGQGAQYHSNSKPCSGCCNK